ncbi:hypothetical protein ACJRO7_010518 [Eucalyptus globulus]|uniref:Uncharacterized protein n=1 Tax=Eucalyptus globulus TaxID=34317 RepID=A0ABD3LC85_EUCGL
MIVTKAYGDIDVTAIEFELLVLDVLAAFAVAAKTRKACAKSQMSNNVILRRNNCTRKRSSRSSKVSIVEIADLIDGTKANGSERLMAKSLMASLSAQWLSLGYLCKFMTPNYPP